MTDPAGHGHILELIDNLLSAVARLFVSIPKSFDIWIDQLCIDQGSASEKTQQVPLMRSIYENAHLVLTWLGKSSANDLKAIKKIQAGVNRYYEHHLIKT